MDKNALINGQFRELSEEEKVGAEHFHRRRLAFAWIGGVIQFNLKRNDDRDHQHWLLEDFGITPQEFEHINRGYMMYNRIQLFKGSSFAPIEVADILQEDLHYLQCVHKRRYGEDTVPMYSGVVVGKVGEIWPPMYEIRIAPYRSGSMMIAEVSRG